MRNEILCNGCYASEWEFGIVPVRLDGTTCPDCNLARLSSAVVEAAVKRRNHQNSPPCTDWTAILEDLEWYEDQAIDALIAARKEASRG